MTSNFIETLKQAANEAIIAYKKHWARRWIIRDIKSFNIVNAKYGSYTNLRNLYIDQIETDIEFIITDLAKASTKT